VTLRTGGTDRAGTVWVYRPRHHKTEHRGQATNLRREFGIEVARLGLGHKHAFTTEIYADAYREKVTDVFARVG
jgi:hypothetical protein